MICWWSSPIPRRALALNTPFRGCQTLQELYRAAGADPNQRATVPVLVDSRTGEVVVGESARLMELLNEWPPPWRGPGAREPGPGHRGVA